MLPCQLNVLLIYPLFGNIDVNADFTSDLSISHLIFSRALDSRTAHHLLVNLDPLLEAHGCLLCLLLCRHAARDTRCKVLMMTVASRRDDDLVPSMGIVL